MKAITKFRIISKSTLTMKPITWKNFLRYGIIPDCPKEDVGKWKQ